MNVLDELRKVADNPYGYARRLKGEGRAVIGYFCSYTPEEIIFAAGAHPMRLFGTHGEISRADAHLQAYCCSVVRGALEEALSGELDFLDGAVFPHTCDSIQRLSDIWRLTTRFKFFADVVLPVKLTTESSRMYMVEVLERFARELESGLGAGITGEKYLDSIRTFNKLRAGMADLYRLRSARPGIVSGSDFLAVVKAAMSMERRACADMVTRLAGELGKKGLSSDAGGRKRIMLAGGVCDHPDIYRLIEESGGVVVWDDLCTGTRAFEGMIREDGNPLEAIAERYMTRLACPAKHRSLTERGERLVRDAKEHKVGGVIFLLLKFCDPHDFDYPYLKESLDREGIPSILVELEHQLPPEGQLRTRFETFMHTIHK